MVPVRMPVPLLKPPPFNAMKMQDVLHELKMIAGFVFLQILNIWSIVERQDVTFYLGTLGTLLMIAYYAIRIYKDLKSKI